MFVEPLSPFMADFAQTCTVAGATVKGIFDNDYADPMGMVGSTPSLLAASAEVASAVLGTTVVINAINYTVAKIQPDGTGLTRLLLQEV